MIRRVKVKSLNRVRLFSNPWAVAYQAPPSMGFSRQEYQSGVPLPSPGDLPNPGIEPRSPALQADALPSQPPVKCDSQIYGQLTFNKHPERTLFSTSGGGTTRQLLSETNQPTTLNPYFKNFYSSKDIIKKMKRPHLGENVYNTDLINEQYLKYNKSEDLYILTQKSQQ